MSGEGGVGAGGPGGSGIAGAGASASPDEGGGSGIEGSTGTAGKFSLYIRSETSRPAESGSLLMRVSPSGTSMKLSGTPFSTLSI